MPKFLDKIIESFPELQFKKGDNFYWSPKSKIVFYKLESQNSKLSKWALMHEIGHALLDHRSYGTDFSLLRMESEAWEKAQEIAKRFKLNIPEEHIQDCLDSYRDWIYKRSICPKCSTKSFQSEIHHYRC